MYANKLV